MANRHPSFLLAFALLLIVAVPLTAESNRRITDDHYFGCKSREYLDKLIDYAVDKDQEAFKQALLAGVLVGECTLFKKGEEVFVVDTKIFSGLIKVRRLGKVEEFWTNLEAVTRPGT